MVRRRAPRPRVAVAGASGLVGRALLEQLAADDGVAEVHALLRRPPMLPLPAGVRPVWVEPAAWGAPEMLRLPPIDHAYCALGTTIKAAGSRAAFLAVDLDAVRVFASAARAAGASRFGLISAMGADTGSLVFYNRVKGQAEAAVQAQAWPRLVIARPSLLLGDRAALGQPARAGEQWGQDLLPALGPLMPRRWRPIAAAVVARALLRALSAEEATALQVLDNDRLQTLGG